MKKMFALFIVLLLAACSGPALQKLPEAPLASAPEPQATVTTPEPVSAPVVDYSVSGETHAKLLSAFSKITKYAVSETFVQLSAGQHHTFEVGFTNKDVDKDNFLVDVQFKEAYDKSRNPIDGVDAAQVASWLARNDWSVTPLKGNEQSMQAIVIEAGQLASGRTPPKGTYVFTLNVFHQGEYIKVDQDYSGDIDLSVQVV